MGIVRINEFQAAEGKADELFEFLKSLELYVSSSMGCESCEVLRSCDNEGLFVVIERWGDQNSHAESLANYPQDKMAAVMPLFGSTPKGGFYHSG